MRSKLLITSAAALLAGTMFAMGQGATDRKEQAQPGSPGMSQPNKATPGVRKEEANRPSTTGQSPREEQPKGAQSEPKSAPKGAVKEPSKEQPKGAQKEPSKEQPKGAQKEQPGRPATTGQAPREEPNRAQGQNQQNRAPAQTQERNQTPERNQGQIQNREQDRVQGQREGGGTSVTLTTEQRTKIRETVLRGSNAPRLTQVDFAVREGIVIPRTTRIVEVPETIVEIHPQWRGFKYFVYNDEIIIVDASTFRIVAVLEV